MTGANLSPRRRRTVLLAALLLLVTVTGGLVCCTGLTAAEPAGKKQPAKPVTEMTAAASSSPEKKSSETAAADLQHTVTGADEEPDRTGNQPEKTAGEAESEAPKEKAPEPEDNTPFSYQTKTDSSLLSGKGVVTSPAPDNAQTPRFPEEVSPATPSIPVVKKHNRPTVKVKWGNPAGSLPEAAEGGDDAQSRKIASVVSRTGTFLANRPDGKAAASMARGMVTGGAGSALQQWLSRFGTARVQLDMDDRFSLRNSQLDLLVPLYEQKDRLVFTQGSLHRTDDRSQANLGAGFRHFYDRWMFGGNTFADYDLSRDHARAGAGLEYWRDFLKLGFNGYVHLTGWKDAPDLEDYEARPANGWDVRAQAWLPSLPQLGGKLTYEQYYGKEVALSGVNDRRKNPRALTAGINYTPFPLLTLSAEQRQGLGGKSDTRLGINLSYQPGVPWQQQINPDAVGAMRSLAGSRYDLVERNNNIVLEYSRKEVIRLRTAPRVTGYQGEQKSLGVSVTSRHGLARIDWEASALLAAGGNIVRNGGDWMVLLPAYRPAAVNTWTVSGVAVDTRGNRSDRSVTQVTVRAPAVSRDNSKFTPEKSTLPADGRSRQVLTLTLRDENNRAADLDVKDVTLSSSRPKSATLSAMKRKSAGVYTVTVTAGTDTGTVTVTPSVRGVTLSPATVTIISTTPDAGLSVFSANPEIITADNMAASTLMLVAKDELGRPMSGLKDSLTFAVKDSSGKVPAAGVITESAIAESGTKGTYTATLKGTAAGKYTVVPEYNGTVMGSLSAAVTLTASAPDRMKSGITTDRADYVSGTDMQVTVTVKDAQGNAVTGEEPSLTTDTVKVPNATMKAGRGWKDNGDGTYTATYSAIMAGTDLRATVKLPGWSGAADSGAYTITLSDEAPDSINTHLNPYTYNLTGEDGTFPDTGFVGATFTIVPKNKAKASDYTWTSDAPWVSVNDGVVRFTDEGTGNKVTIIGTPKSYKGNIIRYSFTLKSWFVSDKKKCYVDTEFYHPKDECYHACDYRPDYSLPTVWQLNQGEADRGHPDGIWNEWGNLNKYPGSNITEKFYWSSSFHYIYDELFRYNVDVINGMTFSGGAGHNYSFMCRKAF